jgi:hypothetical protein
MSTHRVITDTLAVLLGRKETAPMLFFVQLLQACIARSSALSAHVIGSSLHHECATQLHTILRAPARADGDWSISYPLGCSCADCKVLGHFLDSARAEYDWPLNKQRRQHIHHAVASAKLPVLHTTLRRGSPQVLQLRKDRSLFTRERAYRFRVKEILEALPATRL